MNSYTVLYAEDVPHYGTGEFDAADDTLALERARAITPDAMSNYTNDPDYNNTRCRRIVHIEGADGTVAEDIYLSPDDSLQDSAHHLAQALELSIRAMNAVPSFDTGITNPEQPKRTLSSYQLLPKLEAILIAGLFVLISEQGPITINANARQFLYRRFGI
jgi:hypothetical protein